MPTAIYAPPTNEQLYHKINSYYGFTRDVFNFLNGYINPYNPCILHIEMFNTFHYGEFSKPNHVAIFLGNICRNHYSDDMFIKKIIITSIAHELSHSSQELSMMTYVDDMYYKNMIEDSNEAYTEIWITQHADEIRERFGVDVWYTPKAVNDIQPHIVDYRKFDVKNYFINAILDTVYRNLVMKTTIEMSFDKYQSITFHMNDSPTCLIKYNGRYNPEAIPMFCRILNDQCKCMNGPVSMKFIVKNKSSRVRIYDDNNGLDFYLTTSSHKFNPITFHKS